MCACSCVLLFLSLSLTVCVFRVLCMRIKCTKVNVLKTKHWISRYCKKKRNRFLKQKATTAENKRKHELVNRKMHSNRSTFGVYCELLWKFAHNWWIQGRNHQKYGKLQLTIKWWLRQRRRRRLRRLRQQQQHNHNHSDSSLSIVKSFNLSVTTQTNIFLNETKKKIT